MDTKMNKLFNDIMTECRSSAPNAHFSISVRSRLEKYPKMVRTDIVTREKFKRAPLFHACAKGQLQMVEYLISTCGADPEQKGWHSNSKKQVSPLWHAIVAGKFSIVKSLITHGCQVNALSDGKKTALEVACGTTNFDIIEYLLEHGADVNARIRELDGQTLLMRATYDVKLCRVLLRHGADINATDRERKTALHHAIESQRLNTVKLLLEHNADPYLRSHEGDDALQAAVLYGCRYSGMALFLTRHISYSPERLANMYELLGSCTYLEDEDAHMTLVYWRKAIEVRKSTMVDGNPLAKKPSGENFDDDAMEKRLCYGNASEFSTLAELDAIARNSQAFSIQCLLIYERILGKRHQKTLTAIMDTARKCRDYFTPSECIALWTRALECSEADSTDLVWVAEGLADEMIQLDGESREAGNRDRETEGLRFADVVGIFKSLRSIFSMVSQKNLSLKKVYMYESRNGYDSMAAFIVYAIYWLIRTARTSEDECEAREHVRCLIELNPKFIPENDTLLHFYVTSWYESERDLRYFEVFGASAETDSRYLQVAKLLLECGARVNARNAEGETPLHKACSRIFFSDPLNKLLVEYGAHLDTPDGSGSTPARVLSAHPRNTIDVESHMTLRCHAARAIAEHEIPCNNLPASLQEFVDLHRRKI